MSIEATQDLSDHWELLRGLYHPFESGLKASSTDVYRHEIPGGQYSNLRPRAIQLGLGDQWGRIKRTYHDVNEALGDIIKVTPTSKVVADFAMFLVQNDMEVQDIFARADRGESMDFPQSVVDFFMGRMGQPYSGFPERLQRIVLRDQTPYTTRAGLDMPDYVWSEHDEALEDILGQPPTEPQRVSYALYPKVFEEFATRRVEFGRYDILDTVTFLYGLEIGEERLVDLEEGKTLVVQLSAIGELDDEGMRRLYYQLNGQPREIEVRDLSASKDLLTRPKADAQKRRPRRRGDARQGPERRGQARRRGHARADPRGDRGHEDGDDHHRPSRWTRRLN